RSRGEELMPCKPSAVAPPRARAAPTSASSASMRACVSAKDERRMFFGRPRTALLALCLISRASRHPGGDHALLLFVRPTLGSVSRTSVFCIFVNPYPDGAVG